MRVRGVQGRSLLNPDAGAEECVEMVMNDITDDGKWGAEIRVGGVRPDWLADGTPGKFENNPGLWLNNTDDVTDWNWNEASNDGQGCPIHIRLKADHPHYQKTQPIDWSAPIEVLLDGSWVPARIEQRDGASDRLPYCLAYGPYRGQWFTADGKHCNDGEYARNVQPATQTQTQTLTAQERLARMEAFIKKLASSSACTIGGQIYFISEAGVDEARALVAEMEPVDPDLAEANKIARACGWRVWEEAGKPGAADWESSAVKMAYDAIKRGRELARGEGR